MTPSSHAWRKSSHSDVEGNCVELARDPRGIAVRDSKDPGAGIHVISRAVFAALIAGLKTGR